jgi:nicotinamidase-related amidase
MRETGTLAPEAREFGDFSREDLEKLVSHKMGEGPRVGFGESCGLLVVDMTRAVVEKSPDVKSAADHTAVLLAHARRAKIPIFFTHGGRHLHSVSFAPMTDAEKGIYAIKASPVYAGKPLTEEGFQIAQEITPLEGEVVIQKHRSSAFVGTFLTQLLNWYRLDTLIITGMSTTGCHFATVRDAFSNNYRVIIPEECCAAGSPRDKGLHYVNLLQMDKSQGDVVPVSVVLDHLARIADES